MNSVAIIGSRDYGNLAAVRDYVNRLPEGTVVISGGARGVDSAAAHFARERKLKVIECLPDWNKYRPKNGGKNPAGMIRNHDIIKAADRVVCFWDLKSKGSAHSIGLCKQYAKPLEVIP